MISGIRCVRTWRSGSRINGVIFVAQLVILLLASSIAAGFEFPGTGCHLVIEKNEWAAGCVPAVNFVVKLSNCDDGTAMSDVTILFLDESNHELGRDYFAAPTGQCSVSGYGNVRTITPRGGNHVFMVASADLCGKQTTSISSNQVPTNGQVADCF